MNFDHLPRKAGAQVARLAVHHAQERGNVVRQLRASPEPRIVNVREVIFQVNPGTDWENREKDPGQDRQFGVVFSRIIRCQKRTAVQEQATTPFTSSNDRDRIGRMSKLGPSLGEILGSLLDVLARLSERRQRSGHEPAASLVGVTIACRVDLAPDPVKVRTVRCRDAVQIIVNN